MMNAKYLYIFGAEIKEEYLEKGIQAESKPFTRTVPAKHEVKIIGGLGVYFKPMIPK